MEKYEQTLWLKLSIFTFLNIISQFFLSYKMQIVLWPFLLPLNFRDFLKHLKSSFKLTYTSLIHQKILKIKDVLQSLDVSCLLPGHCGLMGERLTCGQKAWNRTQSIEIVPNHFYSSVFSRLATISNPGCWLECISDLDKRKNQMKMIFLSKSQSLKFSSEHCG